MKSTMKYVSLALLLFGNCACSTVLEGRSQDIIIASNPLGAQCNVVNNGDVIATVEQTPGTVTIQKDKNDIYVECSKEGYVKSRKKNLAGMALTSLGNMAFLQYSFIGNGIDSLSGASHKYDSTVFITLDKDITKQVEAAQIAPHDATPASFPAAAMPIAAAPQQARGQVIPPHAQQLAQQLVQALNEQQTASASDTITLTTRTQELAAQLSQEVTQ